MMLAIGVIAVALCAVLSMTIHSNTTREHLRENEIAKEAAFRKLDEIRALPWGNVGLPVTASVCDLYVATAALPQLVPGLRYELSPSIAAPGGDPWNTTLNNPNRQGKLQVLLRGVNHGSSLTTSPFLDPINLIDVEVLVQWTGVNGRSHYSTRAMLTRSGQGN
jgi:hypothetical protein